MTFPRFATLTKGTPTIRVAYTLVTLSIVGLLALPTVAAGEENSGWVIPPGREEILGKILGTGEELPGGCKLAKGDIQYAVVNATYVCNGTEITLELAHPSQAESTPETTTQHFAISSKAGVAPGVLLSALEARAKASEGQFEWEKLVPPERNAERVATQESWSGGLPLEGPMLYLAGAVGLLAIAAFGFMLSKA